MVVIVGLGDFRLQPSDTELAQAAANGDAQAFRALTDRHIADLFRLALSLSGRRADAEDICQETLIGAFKGVRRFDGRSTFKTWMTRILLRQAAKSWKKNKRRNSLSLDATNSSESGNRRQVAEPQASGGNPDARMDLMEVIAKLAPDHRQIVMLRELEGLSYEEISQTLQIPRGTVESRLFRARNELRKLLKDYEL